MMIMLNSFFFFIEKSTEESAARETFIGTGDPFRCIAVLITVKERTLSWMKKQSETCELCPKGRTWCLSLVWPVSFQCILSLFAGLDHAACLQRICFMDALEFHVNRQQCALVPQCCTGRQLNRQAPSQIVLLQETVPATLRRAAECRCFAAGWYQLAIQREGRWRTTDEEEAARRGKARP